MICKSKATEESMAVWLTGSQLLWPPECYAQWTQNSSSCSGDSNSGENEVTTGKGQEEETEQLQGPQMSKVVLSGISLACQTEGRLSDHHETNRHGGRKLSLGAPLFNKMTGPNDAPIDQETKFSTAHFADRLEDLCRRPSNSQLPPLSLPQHLSKLFDHVVADNDSASESTMHEANQYRVNTEEDQHLLQESYEYIIEVKGPSGDTCRTQPTVPERPAGALRGLTCRWDAPLTVSVPNPENIKLEVMGRPVQPSGCEYQLCGFVNISLNPITEGQPQDATANTASPSQGSIREKTMRHHKSMHRDSIVTFRTSDYNTSTQDDSAVTSDDNSNMGTNEPVSFASTFSAGNSSTNAVSSENNCSGDSGCAEARRCSASVKSAHGNRSVGQLFCHMQVDERPLSSQQLATEKEISNRVSKKSQETVYSVIAEAHCHLFRFPIYKVLEILEFYR
jgi:hypothetical protein